MIGGATAGGDGGCFLRRMSGISGDEGDNSHDQACAVRRRISTLDWPKWIGSHEDLSVARE
jgi:hypothetical protein